MDIKIMKTTPKRRSSGFTLIEALITISIASILASIAIPSFTKMIESNRISAASNDFLSALMYARSEAAKRSMSVSVCTSNDGASCNSSLNDYAAGWIIFTDCDDSGTLNLAATTCDLDGDGTNDSDLLLRVQQPLSNLSITATATSANDFFTYRFSGRPVSFMSFNIGPDASTTKKKIAVARTGRVKLEDY